MILVLITRSSDGILDVASDGVSVGEDEDRGRSETGGGDGGISENVSELSIQNGPRPPAGLPRPPAAPDTQLRLGFRTRCCLPCTVWPGLCKLPHVC